MVGEGTRGTVERIKQIWERQVEITSAFSKGVSFACSTQVDLSKEMTIQDIGLSVAHRKIKSAFERQKQAVEKQQARKPPTLKASANLE